MKTRYRTSTSRDFFDAEKLMLSLSERGEVQGEIFTDGPSAVKIPYNLQTGEFSLELSLKSVNQKPNVENSYSPNLFPHITQPIADAICFVAQRRLLAALNNLAQVLGDTKVLQMSQESMSPAAVTRALFALQRSGETRKPMLGLSFFEGNRKPMETPSLLQKALSEALKNNGIDSVRSYDKVEKIMDQIQRSLRPLQKQREGPS